MTRLPMVPDDWLVGGDASEPAAPADSGAPDTGEPSTITGLLQAAASQPMRGNALSLMMDPSEIATIPGLPEHYYEGGTGLGDYADPRVRQGVGGFGDLSELSSTPSLPSAGQASAEPGNPAGYVPALDQVSLAPHDWNPSGLDISAPATQSASSNPGEKYAQGGKAAEYFGNGIDWWNQQNKILGLHFGQEGPKLLEKYTGPVGTALGVIGNGLDAAGEIKNGAPVIPTVAGAGIKTVSSLGGAALGAAGGAAVGGVIGGALGGIAGGVAPDWVYRNMSDQQLGEAAGRVLDNAGRSYRDYVIDNPYYDPRLAMP